MAALMVVIVLDQWSERTISDRQKDAIAGASAETIVNARMLRYQWEATLSRSKMLHRLARELALTTDAPVGEGSKEPTAAAHYAMRQSEIIKVLEFGALGEFAQVALVNEHALVTWSTMPLPIQPIDLAAREHIRAILQEGREWFVGTPVIGRVSGKFTIQMAAAVRDPLGQLRGVSVVSLSVVALGNYLRDLGLGPRDLILIIRTDGMVLGSNDEELIARPLPLALRTALHLAANASTAVETQVFGRHVVAGSLAVPNEDTIVAVLRDIETVTEPVRRIGQDLHRQVQMLQAAVLTLSLLLGVVAGMRSHTNAMQRLHRLRELHARSREAFARIAEAGPGVLYRLCPLPGGAWRIDVIGSGLANVTGYSVAEGCEPAWLTSTAHPDDRAELTAAVSACFAGRGRIVEYRMRSRGGRWIWVQNTLHPSCDPELGRIAIGYLLDVTQRKETALILAQTNKLSTLGEMAAGMAHELNQPLATIAMAAENARETLRTVDPGNPIVSSVLPRLDRILGQSSRAARLIDHLRVFARREGDHDRPVSVPDAVAGAILLLESRLKDSSVRVEQDFAASLPSIVGNQILLEQVLVNLMLNCMDAYDRCSEEGTDTQMCIRITASLENDELSLTVSDHAGGIPPNLVNRVFEPFFTTKPEGKGTGLGLSFSYGIISGMNGSLTMENRDGGAAFTIRLPIASSAALGDLTPDSHSITARRIGLALPSRVTAPPSGQ